MKYAEGLHERVGRGLWWPLAAMVRFVMWLFFVTPEHAVATAIFAATSPKVAADPHFHGAYLAPSRTGAVIAKPTALAQNKELAQELWQTSEQVVKNRLAGQIALR